MSEFQIRPTVAPDLPRLMGMDHTITSDHVWQLELRRDAGQTVATFREVRLPRPINLEYPHDPFGLADEWKRKSMMFTAFDGPDAVGYISLVEQRPTWVAWVTDLVTNARSRRSGVASGLLSAAHAWAAERGLRRVMIGMQSKNHPAIRLAQKHGYEFCGYNDHYYLTQDVALFFAKVLK
jgi:GNAT superfamily N-acetyltransferase